MIDWASVKFFREIEFACPCGVCPGSTHPPMDETLIRALDAIRFDHGHPITVTSGYRCSSHNAAIGGAPDSAHLTGQAVDIRWRGARMARLLSIALDLVERLEIAPHHLHLEHRPERRSAVWVGASK